MRKVIGLLGFAGSGKGTVADIWWINMVIPKYQLLIQ